MAQQVPNFLQPAPIFYGKKIKEGHSAEDFLRIVDTMRKANPNTPDPQFIQQVAGYLRDDASQWFHRLLRGKLGAAAYQTFLEDWTTFKNHFVQMFFKIRNAREQQIDLLAFRQDKDETAIDFVHRTYVAVNEVSERWIDQNLNDVVASAPVITDQTHPELHGVINTDQLRDAFQRYLRECGMNFLTTHENIRDVDHTAKIAAKSLSDSRMRAHAKELGRSRINISAFCDNIENKEISLSAGKSEPQSHKATVASANADGSTPSNQADVNAASAQKKSGGGQKGKKKAKGKPKSGPPAQPKTPCLLCKEWHRYADCPRLDTARRAIGVAETDAQDADQFGLSGNA